MSAWRSMARILLVDDVELFLELERTFLKRFGCEILTARTGEEALQKVRDRRPDAILLDAVMPGMSGYEVCRVLKEEPSTRQIPVIFVSGEPDRRRVAEVGGDGLVSKPIRRETLLEVLGRHLPLVERMAERVSAQLRVRIESDGKRQQNVFSKDLSQEGIFLKTVSPLAVGSQLDMALRLPLPEGSEEVLLRGEVVRRVAEEPDSHLIAGVGIRFVSPPASTRAKVGRFVRHHLPGPR